MTRKLLSTLLLLTLVFTTVITCTACWDGFTPTTPPNNTDSDGGNTNDNPTAELPDDTDNNGNENKPDDDVPFEDYGMNVITVKLDDANVNENGIYTSMEEVGAYIRLYNKLPSNYVDNRSEARRKYTEQNKCSFGGTEFYNREGLLPKAKGRTFYECDIDYGGGSRNAKRIVYSSDGLIFYTANHYTSFSIMRFV